ncbi:MAG: hypothetical protein RIS47_1323 [Bacteroidota bacterium]|jgi:hypothetical protein
MLRKIVNNLCDLLTSIAEKALTFLFLRYLLEEVDMLE